MAEIDTLAAVDSDIIALDATNRLRPGQITLDDFYREIRGKYPDQLLMTDCSTVEEALYADELGFDFIGKTLFGYTNYCRGQHRFTGNGTNGFEFGLLRRRGWQCHYAAYEGDEDCEGAIASFCDRIAYGIANICYVINPEVVVLSGGVVKQWTYLYPYLRRSLDTYLVPGVREMTHLEHARNGNQAGMLGAYYGFSAKHD